MGLTFPVLVFQMMKHAWDSYRQYGWGHNELKPLAKKGHSTNIFGRPAETPLTRRRSASALR